MPKRPDDQKGLPTPSEAGDWNPSYVPRALGFLGVLPVTKEVGGGRGTGSRPPLPASAQAILLAFV